MDDSLDQKIKNILKDLREAHAHSEKFYAKQVNPGKPTQPTDIFEMGKAFDNEKRISIDLELAYSEKYPDQYTSDSIKSLREERDKLTHKIRAWQHRQFPSKYRT